MAKLSPKQIGDFMFFYWDGIPPGVIARAVIEDGKAVAKPFDKATMRRAENWLDTAIAICLAESGGNTRAANPNSTARGLWQIMRSVHGDKIDNAIKTVKGYDQTDDVPTNHNAALFDPRVNTNVASHVWQERGKSWAPWEVYNSGAYREHLGHGKSVQKYLWNAKHVKALNDRFTANQIANQNVIDLASNMNPFGLAGNSIANITQNWQEYASRLAVGFVALVLFVIGMIFVIRSQAVKTVRKAIRA